MKLLRIPEVAQRVRLGKSTIYAMVAKGVFPAPLKQGGGNFWLETEIDRYIETLIAERTARLPRKQDD
ncbi:helix-turn-helix transcriptional regulator [Variovorax atrisoli]|uniref:helix-turn-helix transcriptional regulator n=1 Tax=Variovorax atrisoli TaxID=3394203 RepID=UPI001F0C033B|nr:AlpA family phage regulatory protein [Variovorax sp. 369]